MIFAFLFLGGGERVKFKNTDLFYFEIFAVHILKSTQVSLDLSDLYLICKPTLPILIKDKKVSIKTK